MREQLAAEVHAAETAKLAATYRPVFSGTNPAVMGVLGASTNGRALYLDGIPIQPPPGMLALR